MEKRPDPAINASAQQNSPRLINRGLRFKGSLLRRWLTKLGQSANLAGGGADGVGSDTEGVLDLATQQGQNGDNDERDERNQQAVFNEGLALFFLQKILDHGDSLFSLKDCGQRGFLFRPAYPLSRTVFAK